MKAFQAAAILSSISFTKDNGLRIGFITQELSNDEKIKVQEYYQKFGWLLFQHNEFQDSDIPKVKAEKQSKTPGQRLRDVIFVYFKQINNNEDFETFYRNQMDKIIDFMKKKLD